MIRKVFLLIFLVNVYLVGNSQERLDTVMNYVLRSVGEKHGNVFFDSTYYKYDTALIRKRFSEEDGNEIEFIRDHRFKLRDWKPVFFAENKTRIHTVKEFYREKHYSPFLTVEDSIHYSTFDTWFENFQKHSLESDYLDKYNKVFNLINKSSWDQRRNEQVDRVQPKLMRIWSIYESDQWYLIFYDFMILYGYPHSYPRWELIFK